MECNLYYSHIGKSYIQRTLEQHKTTTPNYKVKKIVIVPKEERITIYNNHEQIIEKEIIVEIHFKYKNEYDNLLNYIESVDKLQVACNG